jgi:hypothetical protein
VVVFAAGAGGNALWLWGGSSWTLIWPAALASWRTYTANGYSIDYPPYWYALPEGGPQESARIFMNGNVGAPLALGGGGAWVIPRSSDGACTPPADAGARAAVVLGGAPATRYVTPRGGPNGVTNLIVQGERSGTCYSLSLSAFDAATRDANAGLFDQIVARFKFA